MKTSRLMKSVAVLAISLGSVAAFAAGSDCCGDLLCCLQQMLGCCA